MFFFSSRRRHTRYIGDWSSDVCSSDLSPVDPKALYLGANVLFKTTSGGHSWEVISPDLSRPAPDVPESIGIFRKPELAQQPRRGVIYTVAPSHQDVNTIWAGTDDGLIHVTRDGGKTWKDVTPPG